jgi:hypothetical protein
MSEITDVNSNLDTIIQALNVLLAQVSLPDGDETNY